MAKTHLITPEDLIGLKIGTEIASRVSSKTSSKKIIVTSNFNENKIESKLLVTKDEILQGEFDNLSDAIDCYNKIP